MTPGFNSAGVPSPQGSESKFTVFGLFDFQAWLVLLPSQSTPNKKTIAPYEKTVSSLVLFVSIHFELFQSEWASVCIVRNYSLTMAL